MGQGRTHRLAGLNVKFLCHLCNEDKADLKHCALAHGDHLNKNGGSWESSTIIM